MSLTTIPFVEDKSPFKGCIRFYVWFRVEMIMSHPILTIDWDSPAIKKKLNLSLRPTNCKAQIVIKIADTRVPALDVLVWICSSSNFVLNSFFCPLYGNKSS